MTNDFGAESEILAFCMISSLTLPLLGCFSIRTSHQLRRNLLALENAAQVIAQRLAVFRASNDTELDASLASLVEQRVGALLVTADPYFATQRDRIVAFAAQNRLPAIYQFREYAVAGGLISYGPPLRTLIDKPALTTNSQGAKPADLPIVLPTKYEFVINLKAVKPSVSPSHPG